MVEISREKILSLIKQKQSENVIELAASDYYTDECYMIGSFLSGP